MTSSSKTAKTRNMALGKRNKAATTPKKARCAECPILPGVPCRLVCVRTSIGDTPAPQSTDGASNYDTRQFSNLTNQAHGFAPAPLVSGDSEANKEKG